jgi:hypothetical protein
MGTTLQFHKKDLANFVGVALLATACNAAGSKVLLCCFCGDFPWIHLYNFITLSQHRSRPFVSFPGNLLTAKMLLIIKTLQFWAALSKLCTIFDIALWTRVRTEVIFSLVFKVALLTPHCAAHDSSLGQSNWELAVDKRAKKYYTPFPFEHFSSNLKFSLCL